MNKQDIVDRVRDVLGSTRADAERAVEAVVDAVVGAVARGEEVSIAGLGAFRRRERKARTARNPRTGETVQVPATRVPKFTPAKGFKDRVAQGR
ncbi:MAG: DNA-binding protein HU-alpha [Candidatus Parcubacteria bacterium]|nr:MAG: DNA-binding protein HU-alpha [Candidatus Parcubacteria bacterium]